MLSASGGRETSSKSTIDRIKPLAFHLVRWGLSLLQRLAPKAALRVGSWLFCHPKRARVSPGEAAVLATAQRFTLEVGAYQLAAWSWGDGPTVVLHHGWGGRASQMTAFVAPLVDAGFSVLAYDAPAHGESPGRISSAPEMARILRLVERRFLGIHAVITHSLGGAAALLAIAEGLRVRRAVLLAPPADLRPFVQVFAQQLGLDPLRVSGLGEHAAARFGARWPEMHVRQWARGRRPSLLVYHDGEDELLDLSHAETVIRIWGRAELVVTEGLGHRKIRQDAAVVDGAVRFLCATRPVEVELEELAVVGG